MAIKLPNASRSAMADALVDLCDAGAGAATVQIRTGSGPADPDSAADGTLLVTITLNDPAFGAAANGVATLDNTPEPEGTAVASGTAGYFRVLDSDSNHIYQGTVGEGSGDISLDNTDIATSQVVRITSLTLTMPDGQ